MQDIIEHLGVVNTINPETISVQITPVSACGTCASNQSCSVGNSEIKIIEIRNNYKDLFSVGEKVRVYYGRKKGLHAVFLGYILPLLIILISLPIGTYAFNSENVAGLVSLLFTVVYYMALYFFNRIIAEKFSFSIKKFID